MSTEAFHIPGMEQIRIRFILLLEQRKIRIAHHALEAWESTTHQQIAQSLQQARAILHQIGGTAGTVGYPALGHAAQQCEARIIAHVEGPDAGMANCPPDIIDQIDRFVCACNRLEGSG